MTDQITFDNRDGYYHGELADGTKVKIDADVVAETAKDMGDAAYDVSSWTEDMDGVEVE